VNTEHDRKSVTRRIAAGALVAVTLFEIGTLVWFGVAAGTREGFLRTSYLLFLVLSSCAILAQAGAVWVVVGRDPAASPTRRAVLCLTVALAVGLPTFVFLSSDEPSDLADAVCALSFSLASMSSAILVAIGVGRISFSLASRSSRPRTFDRTA
jgi:hypothetical protein